MTTSSKSGSRPGWCCRAGKSSRCAPERRKIAEAYVYQKDGEAFLFGANITPLNTTSTARGRVPIRTRKLLLSKSE